MYDREERLVLACSDVPGDVNFARPPDDSAEPVTCPFATVQAYDPRVESDLLDELVKAHDLGDFLERLARRGFRVREGRPRIQRIARL